MTVDLTMGAQLSKISQQILVGTTASRQAWTPKCGRLAMSRPPSSPSLQRHRRLVSLDEPLLSLLNSRITLAGVRVVSDRDNCPAETTHRQLREGRTQHWFNGANRLDARWATSTFIGECRAAAFDVRSSNVRRPFIAGNWKMNMTLESSVQLAKEIVAGSDADVPVDVAICPPSVYLSATSAALQGSSVGLGAQNIYHESAGAFTGEISAEMVLDIGCRYVILGHSERRNILGESNEDVNRKVKAALAAGLIPIVCVGELLDEREAGQTLTVIQQQFDGSLADLTSEQMQRCVIAYEPVWAIGTGKVATPDQAEEVHAEIRRLLTDRFGPETAQAIRIQYGGSVKPDNAAELMGQANIDGALVGGASLKADSFLAIVSASRETLKA